MAHTHSLNLTRASQTVNCVLITDSNPHSHGKRPVLTFPKGNTEGVSTFLDTGLFRGKMCNLFHDALHVLAGF